MKAKLFFCEKGPKGQITKQYPTKQHQINDRNRLKMQKERKKTQSQNAEAIREAAKHYPTLPLARPMHCKSYNKSELIPDGGASRTNTDPFTTQNNEIIGTGIFVMPGMADLPLPKMMKKAQNRLHQIDNSDRTTPNTIQGTDEQESHPQSIASRHHASSQA